VEVTGDEDLCPLHATALGFCKTVEQEFKYPCRVVDVHLPSGPEVRKAADHIISELLISSAEALVAYRGNYRWVQRFLPAAPDNSEARPLRNEGVYLIVGGLGRLGLECAQHVAEHVHASLVLVSLTGLPAPRECWKEILNGPDGPVKQKIEKIRALEGSGSKVWIMSADANDPDQMKEIIAEVERLCGRIDGIFYAAGSKTMNSIQRTSREECDRQLRPKTKGLPVLEQVLDGKQLDFVLIASSLASVVGALGYSAYAAAHAFVDSFAFKHNRGSSVPWTCVNFDNWISAPEAALLKAGDRDTLGMSFEEGREVIRRTLCSIGTTQWLVSTGDLTARMEAFVAARRQEALGQTLSPTAHSRPLLQNEYVAPENHLQR
jgi:hypothetical protein